MKMNPFKAFRSLSLGKEMFLLRWVGLSMATLVPVTLLIVLGVVDALELEQIRFLAGHPFYIDAVEAQESLLSYGGMFAVSTVATLYLAAVLLREKSFLWRLQIAFLSVVALALPGILCVLWGGILNMAAPVISVLLLWLWLEISKVVAGIYRACTKKVEA